MNAFQSLCFLLRERPDVVISAGSGMAFPAISSEKLLLKSKVTYVCSTADVYASSRIPKRAYGYSDLFCVQQKEVLKVSPKAKYIGVL